MTADLAEAPGAPTPPAPDTKHFPKPGPGSWSLDSGHFSANSSRICHHLIELGCSQGTEDGFALIGAPLKRLDARFVRGRFYTKLTPLVAGGLDLPTPPGPVLWMVTRTHPAFRRAEKKAAKALGDRIWLREQKRWEDEWKPRLERDCARLSAVDPTVLSNAELADHIEEVHALAEFGSTLHFRLHISDLGPIGLLLVRAREWGLDPVEAMTALSGSSPSTNAPGRALAEIRQHVADQGASPRSLDEVRAVSPAVASQLDGFMAQYGWRLTTGYDLRARTLAEMPDAVLAAITMQPDQMVAADSNDRAEQVGEAALERLRTQVAPVNRDELELIISDARALYGLRDENGPLTWQWPVGLLRRAMLEAARRLVDLGSLPAGDDQEDAVFDLAAAEISALLVGGAGPSVSEIAGRVATRKAGAELTAPPTLGRVEEDPPLWVMPGALRDLMDVILTVLDMLETDPPPFAGINGLGVGAAPITGRACVVTEADEAMAQLEPGDILVAPFTVPTYNAVLAIAGGVVVDNGGLLCHAAVIAREYGIGAVVGTGDGTSRIPHGALIQLDPTAGTVTVLE